MSAWLLAGVIVVVLLIGMLLGALPLYGFMVFAASRLTEGG